MLEASLTEMGFREDEIVAYLTKLKVPSQPVTTMELALRPREAEDEEPREDDGSTRSLSCREMFVDSADMSCSKQGCQYSHEFSFHLRHWGPFRKKMKAGTLSPQVQVLVDAEEKAWEARKAARGSQKPTNDGGMDTT